METKRVHEVVHTLRAKPLHVRQNIAVGVAGGITLVVAFGWFFASATNGTFSLAPSSVATAVGTPDVGQVVSSGKDGFSQLAGAAGAVMGASSSPAAITVVDTEVHTTLDKPQVDPNATVIHF